MNHYTRWLALKEENPGQYARDIAGLMNISEAELTFARVGHDAWRLHGDIREIIGALEAVGETKCICRNDYAVHEQVGAFTHQHLGGHAGLVLNPRALDLRLFLNQWRARSTSVKPPPAVSVRAFSSSTFRAMPAESLHDR